MCGLAGILRLHPPGEAPDHLDAIPEHWLDILDDSINHRGPDGTGRFRDRVVIEDGRTIDVALVHRRLAILDAEGGRQPMVHDGERLRPDLTYRPGAAPFVASERVDPQTRLIAVVFNGCIYNHAVLRREIGGAFESDHADTEVIPRAYCAWGATAVARLDGMFALGVWDRRAADVVIARDRAGEKPLYTFSGESGLRMFASSAAGVTRLAAHLRRAPIDLQRGEIVSALYHGWTHGSGIVGVHAELEPSWLARGAPAHKGDDAEEDHAGWWPWAYAERRDTPLTADEVESLLRRSVHDRLESDVPLAVFLSGGVDSGLVAALARERRPDLTTLTVRMPDPRYDESEAAIATARHLGTTHRTLECHAEPAEDLVRLIQQLGAPLGDSSLLPAYWLCRATREIAGVALSGDGGDEVFGGYQRHAAVGVLRRWRTPLAWLPAGLFPQRDPTSRSAKAARLIRAARRNGFHDLRAVFASEDLDALLGAPRGRVRPASLPGDPLLDDFRHYLPHDLMRKTDTASMAVALEVRAPFLARAIVDRALAAPLGDLMPGGARKGLLKRVARRHLPPEIVDRPKMGFAIPIGEWFRTDFGGLRTLLLDHLLSSDPFPGVGEAGLTIDAARVRRLLREHDDAGSASLWPWKGRDHAQRLYALLVVSIWARWLRAEFEASIPR